MSEARRYIAGRSSSRCDFHLCERLHRSPEDGGEPVPHTLGHATWVESSTLEQLVVAAHLAALFGGKLAGVHDRVDDVVDPQAPLEPSPQEWRVVEGAHVGQGGCGRLLAWRSLEEAVDQHRELVCARPGPPKQILDVERLASCVPTNKLVEQRFGVGRHASSHSRSLLLLRWIA